MKDFIRCVFNGGFPQEMLWIYAALRAIPAGVGGFMLWTWWRPVLEKTHVAMGKIVFSVASKLPIPVVIATKGPN